MLKECPASMSMEQRRCKISCLSLRRKRASGLSDIPILTSRYGGPPGGTTMPVNDSRQDYQFEAADARPCSKRPDASGEAQCVAQADAVGVVKSVTVAVVLPVSVSNSSNVGTLPGAFGFAPGTGVGSDASARVQLRRQPAARVAGLPKR